MTVQPVWLRAAEVDRAPDAPGLYAWYAVPDIGPGDDRSQASFAAALSRTVDATAPAALDLQARPRLGLEWEGTLRPKRRADLAFPHDNDQFRREIRRAIATVAHFFEAPIYVGRAIDQPLRARLKRHVDDFHAADGLASDSFGARARSLSLSLSELRVACWAPGFPPDPLHNDVLVFLERYFLSTSVPSLSRQ